MAEKYTGSVKYAPGTVVRVSENEKYDMESADAYDEDILGVISEKPAFVMNSESKGQIVGLIGKLPIRVTGVVRKGEPIMPWKNGTAIACRPDLFDMDFRQATSLFKIGYALESKADIEEQLIMCILKK